MVEFILGVAAGAMFGILIMAMMVASSNADDYASKIENM